MYPTNIWCITCDSVAKWSINQILGRVATAGDRISSCLFDLWPHISHLDLLIQGAPNTLSRLQGENFSPVIQVQYCNKKLTNVEWIHQRYLSNDEMARSQSSWKTCGRKTEGAHDRRMKCLFTPCYDREQSCAHTVEIVINVKLGWRNTLWRCIAYYVYALF